jgi:hypothetical protein
MHYVVGILTPATPWLAALVLHRSNLVRAVFWSLLLALNGATPSRRRKIIESAALCDLTASSRRELS